MSEPIPTAFDAFAADYDQSFSHTRLGQLLRSRVWDILTQTFSPGQHLLELTCGAGEDARYLASQHNLHITATDASAKMIAVTRKKAEQAGLSNKIQTRQIALQDLNPAQFETPFDGLYSNFGGLNTINAWSQLGQTLAQLLKPGGKMVLVPMGPFCPWEMAWYLAHGQAKTAFRRFRQPAMAQIGPAQIPIWYPSARQLRHALKPWFKHQRTQSLELWLPPSYLGHLVERWPGLFETLNRLEQATAGITQGWGDHYISVFERRVE